MVFTGSHAREDLARFESQGACESVRFLLAWRPWGIQAAPTLGHKGRARASAKPLISGAGKCSACNRIRAQRSIRAGSASLARRLARFHTQPIAWRQRLTVQAETSLPCLPWSGAAKVTPLQGVRHQPEARGGVLSKVPNERRIQGKRTVVRTGAPSAPLVSTVKPSDPARERRTVRDPLEREQNRHAAISVG